MGRSVSSAFVTLSLFTLVAFTLVIAGALGSQNSQALLSSVLRAQEDSPALNRKPEKSFTTISLQDQSDSENVDCRMSINAYVLEQDSQTGQESILNFTHHPDINQAAWGLHDGQRSQNSPINFNQNSFAQYQNVVGQLSLVDFPLPEEVYTASTDTYVHLAYQPELFDIVRKEIRVCNKSGAADWLCGNQTSQIGGDTINNVHIDCGMNLEFGWVVKRKETAPASVTFFDNLDPSTRNNLDINNDSAHNTLDLLAVIVAYGTRGNKIPADVNSDSVVNALDYTLVAGAIENR